ncbi:uncharacterized protein LOC116291235 [Actinia tenebrosa]|uniref:Uncharacterized protein LOC116291235 n=1 Tax=Actinia tenebrosa TaxID=6105 RepID=A0A6P8HNI1_ACTTE|nr:uncharacterized protein LOC116291235 [Actinia tenebrosa]
MFTMEGRPALALQASACFFFVQAVVMATSTIDTDHITGCHNNNVMLNCPLFQTAKSESSDKVELEWKYRETRWKKLAAIDGDGNRSVVSSNRTRYQNRLTLHPNGSMMIASLTPDDERSYLCKVGVDGSSKHYLVKLNVTCTGKVTVIKREVCIEEDVVLNCDAIRRTNPRKLKQVTWHVKNTSSSNSDTSWSPVVDSDGTTVKSGDGFRMNENGSLSLQSRVRDEGQVMYRCEVSKNVDSPREMHVIVLKNIKCGILKRKSENGMPSTVNVCIGHQAELVCPFLRSANISHVRSVKWHARTIGSSKHLQQLFHIKLRETSNGTVFGKNLARNTSRLHGAAGKSIELGLNGSLLIKRIRSVDEGDYECIVKTRHHHQPYRHLIRLQPISCNDSRKVSGKNATLFPTPSISRPATIKTTAGRVALTTAPAKGINGSTITDRVSNQNSTQEKENPLKTSDLSGTSPTSVGESNQTRNGSQITGTLARFLSGSKKQATIKSSTSTSTWTMMKPSLQTVKTSTRVTTFTTFYSGTTEGDALSKEWSLEGAEDNGNGFICGGVLNNSVGTFQSPNFPSAYPANSHCKWTIRLPQDYAAINVTFHHFDLEDEQDCRRDHVAIFDELGNLVGPRHCGMMDCPSEFQVKGRLAVVIFRSDASLQKTGFKLSYKSDRQAK